MAIGSAQAVGGAKTIEEQPSPDDWNYKFVRNLLSGLDSREQALNLRDSNVSIGNNVRVHRGALILDLGYKTFGQVLRGYPIRTFQFKKKSGATTLTCITTDTFYRWDVSASEWQFASNGTSTTLDGAEASGQTVISLISAAGIVTNSYVGITLDDGTQHQSRVASVASNDITIDDALPSDAASGNAVVEAVALSASRGDYVSAVTFPAQDVMVFANGVDAPQVYNGTTCIDLATLPAGLTTCKFVGVFQNYLLLINCTLGGADHPQRIYNSDTGDHTNFATGNAGFTDLFDTPGHITAYAELGEIRVIYKEKSITRMSYVGSDTKLFNYDTVVEEQGALNGSCVVSLGNSNIVVGQGAIYEYQGGFAIEVIGKEIFDTMFSVEGNLNPARIDRVFLIYSSELKEIFIFYPAGNDTEPKNMIRYNLRAPSWYTRTFNTAMNGGGDFRSSSGETWAATVGTWAEDVGAWNSSSLLSNAPTLQFCGDDKQVYEYNHLVANDDGTAISFSVDTRDFFLPNRDLRFDRFDVELKGETVTVSYSIDEGITWVVLKAFSLTAAYKRVRKNVQFKFRTIRFRFAGTGGGFGIRWFGFKYKRETIW